MLGQKALEGLALTLARNSNCKSRYTILLSLPIALFLFALFGYLHIINFNIKIHSIVMIAIIFLIFVAFSKHNAYYATCKLRKDFSQLTQRILEYIDKNRLKIAGIEKANASLDEFMGNYAKTLRNEHFSSIAAGLFPTLGILGTFISIAISMPDFSIMTSKGLEQEISKLLSGVGTAFYVSIYGIFLSIWWLLFEKSGVSRFQKDANTIKEATKEVFWQKEEIEQTYFKKSMENFEKLNAVFDTLSSDQFVQDLNQTLSQRMEVFENIIAQEQKATKTLVTLLENGTTQLQTISDQQTNLSATLEDVIKQLNRFAISIQEQTIDFKSAHNALEKEFTHATMVAEVLSQNTVKLNEALANINAENVKNLYKEVLDNIEKMKEDIDALGDRFDKRVETFDTKFLEKLKNTLQLIDSETAQIVQTLSKLK